MKLYKADIHALGNTDPNMRPMLSHYGNNENYFIFNTINKTRREHF
jgi:hypothetical protein